MIFVSRQIVNPIIWTKYSNNVGVNIRRQYYGSSSSSASLVLAQLFHRHDHPNHSRHRHNLYPLGRSSMPDHSTNSRPLLLSTIRRYQSSTTTTSKSSEAETSKTSSPLSENKSNNKYQPAKIETTSDTINIQDRVKIIPSSDGIVHVVLSRPNKLNSLDMSMFEAIAEAAYRLRTSEKLQQNMRVVIVSGEGRAFCTGLDAKSMATTGIKSNIKKLLVRPTQYGGVDDGISNLAQDVCYLWRKLPVPVLCVLHGMCFGGGLQIALGADMRYVTKDCQLSIMESRWGLIPDMGASIVLRELIPIDVAKELTMTGKILTGDEAQAIGLVTRCADDPMDEAMKVAKDIVARYVYFSCADVDICLFRFLCFHAQHMTHPVITWLLVTLLVSNAPIVLTTCTSTETT